jgi:hypothetical protein
MEAYRGGDVIDVGAFHGWYASPGDALVSIEPDAAAYATLMQHLAELNA